MSENTPEYTIAEYCDPDGEMSPNADPLSAYLTYVADVRGGAVGEMGFTLHDFEEYIARLPQVRRPSAEK